MPYILNKYEKETVILYNQSNDRANITTYAPVLRRKLTDYANKHPDFCKRLDKGKYPTDFFDCSTYTLAKQRRKTGCSSHYMTTSILRQLVLDAIGRITDERFDSLLAEYEAEQKGLKEAVSAAEQNLAVFAEDSARADSFLEGAKRYTDYSELTTQMLNEFIDKIIIHKPEKIDGDRVVKVDIYFRFIGNFELLPRELTPEEIKREAQLHRHRVKSRERYQKIKAGEHAVGQPFLITCKCCGKTFGAKTTAAMFCGRNCRAKYYRQEATQERSREIVCGGCGKTFTTTRSDVKYCCEECRT